VLSEEVSPGEEVQIIGDSFEGLSAVVTQILPGRQRVALLLEFLGRQTTIEIGIHSIIKQRIRR